MIRRQRMVRTLTPKHLHLLLSIAMEQVVGRYTATRNASQASLLTTARGQVPAKSRWPVRRYSSPPAMATLSATQGRPLKARLRAGEQLYGAFLCSASPTLAEILGWAGYDFVVIDMEHGPGDVYAALPCLQALAAAQTPAILRIAANDPVLAKKAMDLGPHGIMVPMVETAADAAKAVASCRYPPRGIRGAAHPIVRASLYGIDASGYLRMCDQDEVLIMLQIESKEAVAHIGEIAAVDGVDCLQLGPTDLSSSIGYLHDPGHKKAMELLHEAERGVLSVPNVYMGGFAMANDPPKELWKRGYHMVSGSVDLGLFRNAALADVKANKVAAIGGTEANKALPCCTTAWAFVYTTYIHKTPQRWAEKLGLLRCWWAFSLRAGLHVSGAALLLQEAEALCGLPLVTPSWLPYDFSSQSTHQKGKKAEGQRRTNAGWCLLLIG